MSKKVSHGEHGGLRAMILRLGFFDPLLHMLGSRHHLYVMVSLVNIDFVDVRHSSGGFKREPSLMGALLREDFDSSLC
jgi:hypothetical protein